MHAHSIIPLLITSTLCLTIVVPVTHIVGLGALLLSLYFKSVVGVINDLLYLESVVYKTELFVIPLPLLCFYVMSYFTRLVYHTLLSLLPCESVKILFSVV